MSIALSEFWTRLVHAGITDANGCKAIAAAISKSSGGAPPTDAKAVATFLVSAGKLTPYQARCLLADPPRDIRLGDLLICGDQASPPWSRWVPARRLSDGQQGFLIRTDSDNAWLTAHAEVSHRSLQSFQCQTMAGSTLVFTPLPAASGTADPAAGGGLCKDSLSDRSRWQPAIVCQLGIELAAALAAMHQRGLVHGSVRGDHVWISPDGQPSLLRDPSGPPAGELRSGGPPQPAAGWIDSTEPAAMYAAPELFAADAQATVASDLYSLGCLLFWARSGRLPFAGESIEQLAAAHTRETPDELTEAIGQGNAGDPLYRVLAYAMAKNPQSRFADAEQFAAALRATAPLLPPVSHADRTPADPVERTSPTTAAAAKSDTAKSETAKPDTAKPATPARRSSGDGQPELRQTPPSVGQSPATTPEAAASASQPVTPRAQQPTAAQATAELVTAELATAELVTAAATDRDPATPAAAATAPPATAPESTAPTTQATAAPPSETPPAATPPAAPPSRRRKRRKASKAPLVLGSLAVIVVLLLVLLMFQDPNPPVAVRKQRPPAPAVLPRVSRSTPPAVQPASNQPGGSRRPDPAAAESETGYQLVDDDRLLFAPPYAAQTTPPPLTLLPPGPAMVVSARLAAIGQSPLGNELMAAVGPELDQLLQTVATRAAVPLDAIARCSVALHPGSEGWPRASLAIELIDPQPLDGLLDRWQVAASRTADGATIYAGDAIDSDAYFVPAAEVESKSVTHFAVGSVAAISEVAGSDGGAIPLPRGLQSLWDNASEHADLVVLVTPNFLFADGRAMLQSYVPELIPPLKTFLIPDVGGALVTMQQTDQQLFAETRLLPSGGISEAALMRTLNERIKQWPAWADQFIVDSVPDPSWRLLASRLPSMMRFVADQVRVGISDSAVVANTYLPGPAVPQVTVATLLAMNTPPGSSVTAMNAATPATALSIDDMLDREMTVSFEQESLEFAIEAIVSEFNRSLPAGSTLPPVRILGGDLQKMGITQNQQIRDFDKTDVPLRQVLTDLVLGANPDKSASGPTDPKQALIWVVADDPQNPDNRAILVTTREAAKDKYPLPAEFVAAPAP